MADLEDSFKDLEGKLPSLIDYEDFSRGLPTKECTSDHLGMIFVLSEKKVPQQQL